MFWSRYRRSIPNSSPSRRWVGGMPAVRGVASWSVTLIRDETANRWRPAAQRRREMFRCPQKPCSSAAQQQTGWSV